MNRYRYYVSCKIEVDADTEEEAKELVEEALGPETEVSDFYLICRYDDDDPDSINDERKLHGLD